MSQTRTKLPDPKSIHTIVFDFDGVFTDNKVYLDSQGSEFVRCDRADGLGIDLLKRYAVSAGITQELLILSTEKNPIVAFRARKLGLDCHQAIGDKLGFLRQHLEKKQTEKKAEAEDPFKRLIYLGNDLNDLPVIEAAGFSVAPSDAHPLVKKQASVVMEQTGGNGFVRAFVEEFLSVNRLSLGGLYELVSDRGNRN
jgi:3-deoxy-D-manno-octulosonate 8-phosphate phosphatase (KDO 8-P phosphatase)